VHAAVVVHKVVDGLLHGSERWSGGGVVEVDVAGFSSIQEGHFYVQAEEQTTVIFFGGMGGHEISLGERIK
jgi:hypothetical protein